MSVLQAWTTASGGNSQSLQDLAATGGVYSSNHVAKHGAAMTTRNASIGGVFEGKGARLALSWHRKRPVFVQGGAAGESVRNYSA